ncbi:hypothetical protein ACNKHM_01845 [Shigella sonnei]
MPSSEAIYLHDTPNHNLFKRDTRALSSGCVPVNKASDWRICCCRMQAGMTNVSPMR